MKLFDRITLLKAGYTRKEIDQMIEDENREPKEHHEDPEPEKDYKALYEAERKAKEALQKQNRDRDRTDTSKKSDVDTVKDVVASFF